MLSGLALLLAAAGPGPETSGTPCRAGSFPADLAQLGQARVVGIPRGSFLSDDDMQGCPEAGESCRMHAYVGTGGTVLTGRRHDRFTCVWFHDGRTGTAGWMRSAELAPQAAPFSRDPPLSAWAGDWRGPTGEALTLRAEGDRLGLVVPAGRMPGREPGAARPAGNRLSLSGPPGAAGEACRLELALVGQFLVLAADGCGADGTALRGIYGRPRPR
ncbi:hypothetical protein M0638_10005 [Roseomonas sp. NAR14]|uniref:Uncharacterized protein n=1 Tax=Roseomonas acroporae TaxID=2937791 RepID=A0A9X1Y5Q0_9PROT|nr:hypothetical protein [Roseomonas acroporae]MCK8784714.1 hypothetical protein [Roseomonas acroporae]